MAETVTESSPRRPKRRRILDPSSIVPVSVYSNKVSSGLQLKLAAAEFSQREAADDGADNSLWAHFPGEERPLMASILILSDSEGEAEDAKTRTEPEAAGCSSPSPPTSPVKKHSRKVQKKIGLRWDGASLTGDKNPRMAPPSWRRAEDPKSRGAEELTLVPETLANLLALDLRLRVQREVDRMLQSVNSFLSPPVRDRTTRLCSTSPPPGDDDIIIVSRKDDDIIQKGPNGSPGREFPLKVRCRADLQKIPVLAATPLSAVLEQMAATLGVPPQRLLLLREEAELPVDATVGELGLGIADIIECVVMAAEDRRDVISVRLQSKDRKASQEFSIHRDTPLGSVFSQYLSRISSCASEAVCFYFDGSRVKHSQTPAELDMEDGDLVEVWL